MTINDVIILSDNSAAKSKPPTVIIPVCFENQTLIVKPITDICALPVEAGRYCINKR